MNDQTCETVEIQKGSAAGTYYYFMCPECGKFNLLNRKTAHQKSCTGCHQWYNLIGSGSLIS